MFEVKVTDGWRLAFPGGHVGMLLLNGVDNTHPSPSLDSHKRELESRLREKYEGFSRPDLLEINVLKAYRSYYKRFGKTYHVLLQLESVLHKGKSLPHVSPLVDANFAAELETMILTAGHDADLLESPVTIDRSDGNETFVQMNGTEKSLKAGDMVMRDACGVICTVLYGQDRRTPISSHTKRVLYVAYVPPGIGGGAVNDHLERIRQNVCLFSPEVVVEYREVHSTSDL